MRFLTALSGNESNRDVFGVLRGGCACGCERFKPDTADGTGWNSTKQLQCALCGCAAARHNHIRDEPQQGPLSVSMLWVVSLVPLKVGARLVAGFLEPLNEAEEDEMRRLPTISPTALQRCVNTLQDFVRGYFPLHSLRATDVWHVLALLLWTEATIYHLDERNEDAIANAVVEPPESTLTWKALESVLTGERCYDSHLKRELASGLKYWEQERKLCRAIDGAVPPLLQDVEAAIIGKSFDYRVLHLILTKWSGDQGDSQSALNQS
jgi:hypothetical protein